MSVKNTVIQLTQDDEIGKLVYRRITWSWRMPIIPEIQDRLLLRFPRSCHIPLSRAVQEGSYLADHLIAGEPFLNNVLGRDIRGHIRRAGIGFQIDLYCQRGDLPFVTE